VDVYTQKECFNSDWLNHTVEFTVSQTNTEVTLALYRYGKKNVCFDNFILKEKSVSTAIDLPVREEEPACKIYPNPVKTILYISCENNNSEGYIYNLSGQGMMKFQNQDQIDVSRLPKGIYFIKNKSFCTKFTKH